MKTIVVTGADGFIGLHARFFLHEKERAGEIRVVPISKEDFADKAKLKEAISVADSVFHFAGINKGTDEELEAGNITIVRELVEACRSAAAQPHILYASSLHEDRDTSYGRGKKKAGELLESFATETGTPAMVFVLPHVFGEFAKPNYNSAVATFCDDLAHGRESNVNSEGEMELLYVRDVIEAFWDASEKRTSGRQRLAGEKWNIKKLYDLLASFNAIHRAGVFPESKSRLELHLFNTLHSYLFEVIYPLQPTIYEDERGALFEIERSSRIDQVFYSSTKPGKARGNHYHTHKMERFCVVEGEGEILVRRLLSDKVKTFKVSGNKPGLIDMPTYFTHALMNVGDTDLRAVFWISEQYDPEDPDTFPEPV